MPARFLFGPAGSGKTQYCLETLRRLEREGRPAVYLVPEQFTYSADRELCDVPELAGLRHVRVLSFSRLAWWLRELAGAGAPPVVSPAERVMRLRAVLARMAPETLGPLAGLKDRQGFLEEVGRFVSEVRRHGATDFLLRIGRGLPAATPGIARKVEALGRVYEVYTSWLREDGRTDGEENLAGLEPLIASRRGALSRFSFLVDGFLSWTRREREVLVSLALTGASLEIALCTEEPPEDGSKPPRREVFLPAWSSYSNLRAALGRAGVPVAESRVLVETPRFRARGLAGLESRLYGEGADQAAPESSGASAVRLHPAQDRRQEVLLWARQIDEWTRTCDHPVRPGEIAVVLRNSDSYRELIREIFARCDIPFFIDERRTLLAHPRVRLVLSALEVLLSGWRREAVIDFLRNPLLEAPQATIDLLENLSLEYGRNFEEWYAPAWAEYAVPPRVRYQRPQETGDLQGAGEPRDDEDASEAEDEPPEPSGKRRLQDGRVAWVEPLRLRCLLPLRRMEERWKLAPSADGRLAGAGSLPGAEAVAAWREVEETLCPEALSARGGAHSRAAHEDPDWNQRVNAVIDQVLLEAETLWKSVPVALDEFGRTVRAGLAAARLGVPPFRLDQVVIGDVQRSRLQGIRRAIVGGLNEGIFPRSVPDDPILNEQDRRALAESGIPLGPTAVERQQEETYLFYIAVTRASERLLLTWSLLDGEGASLGPSLFLDEVVRALPRVERRETARDAEETSPLDVQAAWELGQGLVTHLAGAIDPADLPFRQTEGMDPSFARKIYTDLYNRTLPEERIEESPPLSVVRRILERSLPAILYETEERLPADLCLRAFPGEEFCSSVSRLQEYATCPYGSFLRSVLGITPRPQAEVSPLETGSLAHAALERFFASPGGSDPAAIDERLGAIFRTLADLPEFRAFQVDLASRYRMRNTFHGLSRFLRLEAKRLETSPYKVHAREAAFGPRDGNPVVIPLPTGQKLLLMGRIDRIDLREGPGGPCGLVIDYKRSARAGLPRSLREGMDLQLAAYLLFLRDVLGWKPAGGLYVPVLPAPRREEAVKTGGVNPLSIRAHGIIRASEKEAIDQATGLLVGQGGQILKEEEDLDELLLLGSRYLASYAATQRSGWIAPSPLERRSGRGPCGRCDFSAVCRFRRESDRVRRLPAEGMLFAPEVLP